MITVPDHNFSRLSMAVWDLIDHATVLEMLLGGEVTGTLYMFGVKRPGSSVDSLENQSHEDNEDWVVSHVLFILFTFPSFEKFTTGSTL